MRNLVITGFMASGKSSAGRQAAARLNRPFVDMDNEIEKRAGKTVRQIFSEDGEAAFRRMERALCGELGARQGLVIACGGGVVVDETNRELLTQNGVLVCLNTPLEDIFKRLENSNRQERPLLAGENWQQDLAELHAKRREAYASIPWQVYTGDHNLNEVVDLLASLARLQTLTVRHPGGNYPIQAGSGLLSHTGSALRAAGFAPGSRFAIVSNPVVAPLYAPTIQRSLVEAGFTSFLCLAPDGEQNKNLKTIASLYDQFLRGDLDRSGGVIALGGGVTGDEAGFAAATFLRGVRFVQVPTSLLSMVDASVGGKTGVDLKQGKNLVGAFLQPELVILDPDVLATLPEEELRSGSAEVIKHGVLAAPALFQAFENYSPLKGIWWDVDKGVNWIIQSLQVKIDVVEEDPLEKGRRAVLNLGHTTGHALEKISKYRLRHGEAVSIGMVCAARIAEETGNAAPGLAERIRRVLTRWELPVDCPPHPVKNILAAMQHDKKRSGKALRWILPRQIGQVEITSQVDPLLVEKILLEMGAKRG